MGAALLLVALAVGALLRLRLALGDDGIYWPDEIYQSLEPAHRLLFGYGLVAWEYAEGARSWALPGVIAGVWKLLDLGGATEPAQYLPALKCVFALVGVATTWAVFRLARAVGAADLHAGVAAMAFALIAPAIYFAPRGMSETLSAFPVMLGLGLALPSATGRGAVIGGSSLLGFATLLRLQNGLFCAGLLVVLIARRAWRQAGVAAVTLVVWAVAYGLLDKLTWGDWFHSAIVYVRFNLVEGKAAQWGTADAGYYARTLFTAMPAASLLLGALALLSARRAPGLFGLWVAFFLLHTLIPHKELRFVFVLLPLLCALAAVGLDTLRQDSLRYAAALAVLVAVAWSGVTHRSLTFGDLGQYVHEKPMAPAYDDFGAANRLLLQAHEKPDLCGLKTEAVHQAWIGGYTYLHRDVPFYAHNGPPRESHHFNYAISVSQWARGAEIVSADGGYVLLRFPWGCLPDRGYDSRLP